jgi:IS5 family transposase
MSKKRRNRKEIGGLFTHLDRRSRSAETVTPLDKLAGKIDFEVFRPLLAELVPSKVSEKGGRPPLDAVFMFKVLVLQYYYGLSDERVEFEILDRTSFQRFLGIEAEGSVPDRTSVWNFKERLGEEGASRLFDFFHSILAEKGLIGTKGRIIDATFTDAPRQRNSREDNRRIKEGGEAPEEWPEAKLRQKDLEARWTKKNDETHFGYKNHVSIDEESKLIDRHETTPANVHDSQPFPRLLDPGVDRAHADSAYRSKEHDELLRELEIENRIHEKGMRGRALNKAQQRSNRAKSRVRARVEHVFAFMAGVMKADRIRTIGIKRAKRTNTLVNLVYNLARSVQLGYAM